MKYSPEPYIDFPCPYCGADCPCSELLVREYAGQNVTRWCETCRRLFDVKMPDR